MKKSLARSGSLLPLLGCLLFGCGSGEDGSSSTTRLVLDEGRMRLNPGQQGLFCRQMAVPAELAGPGTFMTGLDADVSKGTHHLVMSFSDEALTGQPTLCTDTGSGQVLSEGASFQDFAVDPNPGSVLETIRRSAFAGGGGSVNIRFPAGYGKPMPLGFFESNHHVLNVTSEPLEIWGRFDVQLAPAESIEHPMGVFFANPLHVAIDPLSEGTTEATLLAPEALDVVVLTSHAHNFLLKFEMFLYRQGGTTSELLYSNTDWEAPSVTVLDPPVHLEPGDGISFRCTYRNDTSEPLKWGVTGGEMCMPLGMYAYPPGTPRRVPPAMSVAMRSEEPAALEIGAELFGN